MEVNAGLAHESHLMLTGNVYSRAMLMSFERKYIFKAFWGYGTRPQPRRPYRRPLLSLTCAVITQVFK